MMAPIITPPRSVYALRVYTMHGVKIHLYESAASARRGRRFYQMFGDSQFPPPLLHRAEPEWIEVP